MAVGTSLRRHLSEILLSPLLLTSRNCRELTTAELLGYDSERRAPIDAVSMLWGKNAERCLPIMAVSISGGGAFCNFYGVRRHALRGAFYRRDMGHACRYAPYVVNREVSALRRRCWSFDYEEVSRSVKRLDVISLFVRNCISLRFEKRKNFLMMKRTKISDIFDPALVGTEVDVKGWVRTRRGNKNVQFVALNDGSTVRNLQIVFDLNKFSEEDLKAVTTGSSIHVTGKLVESMGKGQSCEVQADTLEIYGSSDPETYPLQKKGHTMEFLREKAHLRPRTATFGAILRIRSALAFAIHKFFNEKGFYYLHTPLITGSDCEGAGAMFQATTLPLNDLPKTEDGSIDYSKDFFGRATALTVSGQLEGELGATALGAIYTFGPTFRAERSFTPRHLSEFWMIEPEMAFYDITDNMDLAEEFVKYCIQYVLDHCRDDIDFLSEHFDPELVNRMEFVLHNDFVRLTYTEGIEILKASGQKFEVPVEWGIDLQSEHERYLVEQHFKKPVILTDYPKDIKAFYMKQNDDGRTVRAMDVLFPKIGEIIGGSEREADYDKLLARIEELNIPMKDMWWYLDTRRFGTVPHSGFGLGFERLMLFVTGMANIRDVIPFPRTPNNAEF